MQALAMPALLAASGATARLDASRRRHVGRRDARDVPDFGEIAGLTLNENDGSRWNPTGRAADVRPVTGRALKTFGRRKRGIDDEN